MNAIVVVFVPKRDGQRGTELAITLPTIDILQQCIDSSGKAVLHEQSGSDRSVPPLWTWFIENPRTRRA